MPLFNKPITAGALVGLLLGFGQAQGAVLESHTINFSNADPALSDLANVHEWGILGRSYIVPDGGDLLAPGATFTDYIAVRFTSFEDFNANDITPTGYGANGDFQLTVLGELRGENTGVIGSDEVEFAFTSGSLDMYLDSPNDGDAFTAADFTNLPTFVDGQQVEVLNLIDGLFGQPSDGDFDFDAEDGRTDPKFEQDQLVEDFVVDPETGNEVAFGLADTNNDEATNADIIAAFQSYFGLAADPEGNNLLTSNDGSFQKAVPAPATVALLGLGLVALGGLSRRRKAQTPA